MLTVFFLVGGVLLDLAGAKAIAAVFILLGIVFLCFDALFGLPI